MIVEFEISTLTAEERLRADRDLLAAIGRWSRHVGWKSSKRGWTDPDETVAVVADDESIRVWHQHPGTKLWPIGPREYPVDSVSQGVDVLCALGLLPHEFSSAWHSGQHAADISPAPGLVRVWDRDGSQWDRQPDGMWFTEDLAEGEADWLELVQAYGPIDVTPPLLVGGEPE